MILFVLILFAHFIGDFPMQRIIPTMDTEKSKSIVMLTLHVAMYSLPLWLFGWFADIDPTWVIWNVAAHWIVDFVTSKCTSYFWRNKHEGWFWITIGFDQFLHVAFLFLTYGLIIGL